MAYWVQNAWKLKVATMARPRGGEWLERDLEMLRREGTDILVSLLTAEEINELELTDEEATCRAAGIRFQHFAISDRDTPPSHTEFAQFVGELYEGARQGLGVVVHCRAGIGRSSLLIAALLVRAGMSVDSAFAAISVARGLQVPDTLEQKAWLKMAPVTLSTKR